MFNVNFEIVLNVNKGTSLPKMFIDNFFDKCFMLFKFQSDF